MNNTHTHTPKSNNLFFLQTENGNFNFCDCPWVKVCVLGGSGGINGPSCCQLSLVGITAPYVCLRGSGDVCHRWRPVWTYTPHNDSVMSPPTPTIHALPRPRVTSCSSAGCDHKELNKTGFERWDNRAVSSQLQAKLSLSRFAEFADAAVGPTGSQVSDWVCKGSTATDPTYMN